MGLNELEKLVWRVRHGRVTGESGEVEEGGLVGGGRGVEGVRSGLTVEWCRK